MKALKEVDLHLPIDDFGTGYSSLSQLSRLPFDTVKIDREFIWNLDESPIDLEVVQTIVRLARALRMGIVAEGVETESQEGYLREFGRDWAQGLPLPQADGRGWRLGAAGRGGSRLKGRPFRPAPPAV